MMSEYSWSSLEDRVKVKETTGGWGSESESESELDEWKLPSEEKKKDESVSEEQVLRPLRVAQPMADTSDWLHVEVPLPSGAKPKNTAVSRDYSPEFQLSATRAERKLKSVIWRHLDKYTEDGEICLEWKTYEASVNDRIEAAFQRGDARCVLVDSHDIGHVYVKFPKCSKRLAAVKMAAIQTTVREEKVVERRHVCRMSLFRARLKFYAQHKDGHWHGFLQRPREQYSATKGTYLIPFNFRNVSGFESFEFFKTLIDTTTWFEFELLPHCSEAVNLRILDDDYVTRSTQPKVCRDSWVCCRCLWINNRTLTHCFKCSLSRGVREADDNWYAAGHSISSVPKMSGASRFDPLSSYSSAAEDSIDWSVPYSMAARNFCELCKVHTTDFAQLQMHRIGKKHQMTLRQLAVESNASGQRIDGRVDGDGHGNDDDDYASIRGIDCRSDHRRGGHRRDEDEDDDCDEDNDEEEDYGGIEAIDEEKCFSDLHSVAASAAFSDSAFGLAMLKNTTDKYIIEFVGQWNIGGRSIKQDVDKCDLCAVRFTSATQRRAHFYSKAHSSKLEKWTALETEAFLPPLSNASQMLSPLTAESMASLSSIASSIGSALPSARCFKAPSVRGSAVAPSMAGSSAAGGGRFYDAASVVSMRRFSGWPTHQSQTH